MQTPPENQQPKHVVITIQEVEVTHFFGVVFCPTCGTREEQEVPRHIAEQIKRGEFMEAGCNHCGQVLLVGEQLVKSPQQVAQELEREMQKQLPAGVPVAHHGKR